LLFDGHVTRTAQIRRGVDSTGSLPVGRAEIFALPGAQPCLFFFPLLRLVETIQHSLHCSLTHSIVGLVDGRECWIVPFGVSLDDRGIWEGARS
jgi:hypothetical protein